MSDLTNSLTGLLDDIAENGLDRDHILATLQACIDMADEHEVTEVRCFRCDRPFRSLESVKYCTKECELGGVPMPYQTREEQARGQV